MSVWGYIWGYISHPRLPSGLWVSFVMPLLAPIQRFQTCNTVREAQNDPPLCGFFCCWRKFGTDVAGGMLWLVCVAIQVPSVCVGFKPARNGCHALSICAKLAVVACPGSTGADHDHSRSPLLHSITFHRESHE